MPTWSPHVRRTALRNAWPLIAIIIIPACSPELKPAAPAMGWVDEGDDARDGSNDQKQPDFGPDFGPGAACDIQALMAKPENGCTNAGCHGAQFQGGLDLLSPGVASRLNGVASGTEACGGQLLVDPSNVDNSLLLRVIDPVRFKAAPCGVMMPLGAGEGVSADTLACFEGWVKEIALAKPEGPVEPVPEFEPVAPSSYVNKVKTLITGKAATPADIKAVENDPAALRTLVTGWVETPEYASKLHDFFEVALEQKLVGSLDTQFMRLRGNKLRALRENLQESFARTAVALVDEGRPFNEILTTRRWAMTTATLVALSFLEKKPNALLTETHTLLGGTGTNSAANRTWYLPGLPSTCTVSTITAADVLELMLGFVQCKGGGQYRFDDTILSDADFSDWRLVTITPGSPANSPTFYDLSTLRGITAVSLAQPRIGFFTTPAFLANWETNEDNQFRVTTSQTLIVALGELFSPVDPTKPVRLDGLAKAHAKPSTTCYGCHQFLDPMREYFAQDFSFTYQPAATASTITPSFAFRNVVKDGGNLSTFANTLSDHPKFATGWTQKLCYWANSQSCTESDPEFQRVAAAFVASSFNFKELTIELFSSPLVTGASETETYRAKDPFVSITRRAHLCQMLEARLGVSDPCGMAGKFTSLVPDDDFGRGSAEPVQTSVTGLFHYAAAEKLCLRLSMRLVGGPAARFQVATPEAALDSMVADLMGLGVGHPRHDATRARLGAHFESARTMSDATTALRSAFTIACGSPEVMAVGL